jgi:hypothetical protein
MQKQQTKKMENPFIAIYESLEELKQIFLENGKQLLSTAIKIIRRKELPKRLNSTKRTIRVSKKKGRMLFFQIDPYVHYNWQKRIAIPSIVSKQNDKRQNYKIRKSKKVNWQKIIDLIIVIARLVIAFYHL